MFSDEFEEVIEITVGVGYDNNYWEEYWWLNQVLPGANYIAADSAETTILALLDSKSFALTLLFEGENAPATVTFDASGLGEFIEKPTDLCE